MTPEANRLPAPAGPDARGSLPIARSGSGIVEWVRWFNQTSPFNGLKPSLAKRVEPRLPVDRGLELYDGIRGEFRMRLDLGINYERQIFLNARDCALLSVMRRILRAGDVFVDAGANLGLLTLVAARRVSPGGRVYAFEPSPETYARLTENLDLNEARNVHAACLGCWHERTEMKLYRHEGESHDAATMGVDQGRRVSHEAVVRTVPLDEAVEGPVKLLKIDVEGAEQAAIRGAERLISADPAPHIIVEVNANTASAFGYHPVDLVTSILERNPSYRLHLIRTKSHRPTTLEKIASFLERHPRRAPSVWFES